MCGHLDKQSLYQLYNFSKKFTINYRKINFLLKNWKKHDNCLNFLPLS